MSRTKEVEQACRRGASMRGSIADAATLDAEVERLEVELDALRAIPGGDTEIYVLDDGSHVTGNRAAELLDDEKTRSERAIGEREEQRQRAEAAEARVKELEAAMEWQPIETALARDCLLYQPESTGRSPLSARMIVERGSDSRVRKTTHWMPLPPPPLADTKGTP